MKKIIVVIVFLFSLLSLIEVNGAEFETGSITDTTLIDDDLKNLKLTPSNYFSLDATEENIKNYFEFFVVAIGENRISENTTDTYVYIYNPIRIEELQQIELTIYLNDSISQSLTNTDIVKTSTGVAKNIYCFKNTIKKIPSSRTYSFDNITYEQEHYSSDFVATFKDTKNNNIIDVDYNYNSMIFVTDDILYKINAKASDDSNWWNQVLNWAGGITNPFNPNIWNWESESISFWFYNFSATIDIEKIIELDLNYTKSTKIAPYDNVIWGTGGASMYLSPVYNDNEELQVTKYPQVTKQIVYGKEMEFNAFCTPASDRINEFQEVSIDKEMFNKYQHSVLVDIGDNYENYTYTYSYTVIGSNMQIQTKTVRRNGSKSLNISQLKMTLLKYETKGTIYNAYVVDDPDDKGGEEDTDNPYWSWWDKLVAWMISHPFETVAIVAGSLIGIPLIISFFPMIISLFVSLIVLIFKVLVFILSLPFRIVLFPFRRK